MRHRRVRGDKSLAVVPALDGSPDTFTLRMAPRRTLVGGRRPRPPFRDRGKTPGGSGGVDCRLVRLWSAVEETFALGRLCYPWLRAASHPVRQS